MMPRITKSERELRRATGRLIATMEQGLGSKEKAEEWLTEKLISLDNTLSRGIKKITKDYYANKVKKEIEN